MPEEMSYEAVIDARYESVKEILEDPRIASEAVPPEYVEWRSPDGLHVKMVLPRGFLGKLRVEFTVSASIRGEGVVVYEFNSEVGVLEVVVTAEPVDGKTRLRMNARVTGINLGRARRALAELLKRMADIIEARASEYEASTNVAVKTQAPEGGRGQQAGALAATVRRSLPQTAKLEDTFFEAEVLIRGRPLYADVIAYTSLADALEPFIDESLKTQVYVKIEFPDGYTLKVLMEHGRIVGVLGIAGDKVTRDYDAVLEAERRAPATATLTVYAI